VQQRGWIARRRSYQKRGFSRVHGLNSRSRYLRDTTLEFKETFNLGNLAKYARTMAAFAHNKGGYIVFRVEPSPHRLKGVNKSKFDECDPAQVTQFLNSHFGPEILWEMETLKIFGVTLGYMYTSEAAAREALGKIKP
jgi:predicted HTH transcriptional regulator